MLIDIQAVHDTLMHLLLSLFVLIFVILVAVFTAAAILGRK